MAEIKISVLLDNNLIQADGLARFTYIPSGRPYLMYTLNEKTVQNGKTLNKVYVSETGDSNTEFAPINEDEWLNIKNIMGVISDGSNQVPNNIQLSKLNPQQYVVGPYKKIAIEDVTLNNIIAFQAANQPNEEQIVQPTGNTQFFDPSLNVSAMEETPATIQEVPNAFSMSTPVPEEAAPMALVEETPQAAPVVQEQVVQTQFVEPVQTTIVQEQPAVENAPVVEKQPAVQVEVQQDELTIVRQSLQTVLNYCNGDMNKLNELLKEQGLTITVENVQTAAPVVEEQPAVQEEYPEPVTSVIDINNIPLVEQEAPAEENVLNEESFEPTVPTLPVDNMEAPQLINDTPSGVIPGVTQEPVMEMPQMVQQPVVEQQPMVQEAPVEMPQMAMPEEVIMQTVAPEAPVQESAPVVQEQPAPVTTQEYEVPTMLEPVQFVQPQEPIAVTQIIESNPVVEQAPTAVDAIQNTEVNIAVPNDIKPADNLGMPPITPVTQADLTPVQETVTAPVTPQTQEEGIDTSQFLDAGPVIMPVGQEGSMSQGLPGDSGAKVLERVA